MRLIWLFILSTLLLSCNSGVKIDYVPYHETIKIRELINEDEYMEVLYKDYHANPTTQAQKDQNLIIEYLTDNKITALKTESGLYFKVFRFGNGDFYQWTHQFSARYTGYFLDGKIFDQNLDHDVPLVKRVGEMIQGWNEGVALCSRRTKVTFFIPSHLGYGKTGVKGIVPPNSVLIFDVELSAE